MTVWASIRRFATAITLFSRIRGCYRSRLNLWVPIRPRLIRSSLSARRNPTSEPAPTLTGGQLRELAAKAENNPAIGKPPSTAYCHLFVVDRDSAQLARKTERRTPASSARFAATVTRASQLFATGMQLSGSLDLFAEVIQKVPTVYAERDKAAPQKPLGSRD